MLNIRDQVEVQLEHALFTKIRIQNQTPHRKRGVAAVPQVTNRVTVQKQIGSSWKYVGSYQSVILGMGCVEHIIHLFCFYWAAVVKLICHQQPHQQ